jgi:hypothetical protein
MTSEAWRINELERRIIRCTKLMFQTESEPDRNMYRAIISASKEEITSLTKRKEGNETHASR